MRQKRIKAWAMVSQRGNMLWNTQSAEGEVLKPVLYKTLRMAQEATKSFPAYKPIKVDVIVRETP